MRHTPLIRSALWGYYFVSLVAPAYSQDVWNNDVGTVLAIGHSGSTLLVGSTTGLYIGDTVRAKTTRVPIEMGPIRCFLTLHDQVLIGSDAGLFSWELSLHGTPKQETGEVTGPVLDLKYLDGNLWIGAEKGLFKWRLAAQPRGTPELVWASSDRGPNSIDSRVYQILPLGDLFLVASNAGLLTWPTRAPKKAPKMLTTPAIGPVIAVAYREPNLWISTYEHGLFVWNVGRFPPKGRPVDLHRLGLGNVYKLNHAGTNLWLATTTGLWIWENAPRGDLYGIPATVGGANAEVEMNGALFVGSAKGLLRLPLPAEKVPYSPQGVLEIPVDDGDDGTQPVDGSAASWSASASQRYRQGDYAEAILYVREALQLRSAAHENGTLELAQDLHLLGIILSIEHKFSESLVNVNNALDILTRLNARHSALGAAIMRDLGYLLNLSGLGDEASEMYGLARSIGDLPEAEGVPDLGKAFMRKGDILFNKSDYGAARAEFENSLLLTTPSHPEASKYTAEVKFDLGQLFVAVGDFASAAGMFADASAAFEKAPGDNRYLQGRVLTQLGTMLCRSSDFVRAIELLTKAKDLLDQPLGDYKANPQLRLLDVSTTSYVLAQADAAVGDYSHALPLFDLTRDYYQQLFGGDSLPVADVLVQTLMLPDHNTNTDAAILRRVEGIIANHSSNDRLAVVQGLAMYYMSHNKLDLAMQREALASSDLNAIIKTNLEAMSLAQQQLFLMDKVTNQIGAVVLTMLRGASPTEGYDLLLKWKGLLLEGTSSQRIVTDSSSKDQLGDMPQRLAQLRSELHYTYFNKGSLSDVERRKKIDTLSVSKEQLERDIVALGGSTFWSRHLTTRYTTLQEALAEDEAFVDFYRYKQNPERLGDPSWAYAAIVSAKNVPPRIVDLGNATNIDQAVSFWFEAASQGKTATEWQRLVELIWNPVSRSIPRGILKIWASPDGELARVPLQLLCESTHSLAQVDSAEELIGRSKSPKIPPATDGRLLIVGAVNYDAMRVGDVILEGNTHFRPLPGTLQEIRTLQDLAENEGFRTTVLKNDNASKKNVIRFLSDSVYVHLATHGYFYPVDHATVTAGSFNMRSIGQFGLAGEARSAANPMAFSGIALAGANLPSAGDSGALSAEEVMGLDLSKTRLVVMSACETGRGEVVPGSQGILGFRAALLGAGTETLIASLWNVPNEATTELMTIFYTNLWQRHMNVYDSLAAAQKSLKLDPRYSTERYWAAWVIVGRAW